MKLKSLLVFCCLVLVSSVFAANRYTVHPHTGNKNTHASSVAKRATLPAFCEIEIINSIREPVVILGVSENSYLSPLTLYPNEIAYIDLYDYDYDYCHDGMNLNVDTYNGYNIYHSYTRVHSTLRIVNYMNKQIKAEVKAK